MLPLLAAFAAGCELQEIVTAEPHDLVVAEVVLRSGEGAQFALLQRTTARPGTPPVANATIEVTDDAGRTMRYRPEPLELCVDIAEGQAIHHGAACYIAAGTDGIPVLPGRTYTLRIETDEGAVLTGTTTLPAPFSIVRPAATACALPPAAPLLVEWTVAGGAWAYLAEARFSGLRDAFAGRGIEVPDDPFRLTGVSVSGSDTTMTFPGGFGIFNRFDEELVPLLVALQDGMPPGVNTMVTVAAADRNYVNWVRGGNFNPSGPVRVGSIRGDGIGVFGSITLQRVRIDTRPASGLPAC